MAARRPFPWAPIVTGVLIALVTVVVGFTGCSHDKGGPGPLPQPQCELSTTALDLDSVTVGECGPTTSFTIKNTGDGTLEGSVVEPCDDFAITDGGGPFRLEKDATRVVTIRFCPASGGIKTCAIATGVSECASIACTGVAVVVPAGACCQPGGDCTVTAETTCQAPSVWHSEWSACQPNNCPVPAPTAACCTPTSGACTLTIQAACQAPLVWHADWPSCDPTNPCPPPNGACCNTATGGCSVTTQALCREGSVWHQEWQSCSPTSPCPLPATTAACCVPSTGACSVTTQALCTGGSTWHQEWPSCSPANPCPLPTTTGACCVPSTGACSVTTQALCTGGSVWHQEWPSCSPTNPCPLPTTTGACCVPSTGACSVTTQALCTGGSTWHQEWPSCSPANPCPLPTTTGACCVPSTGACSVTTQALCTGGSVWHQEWPSCSPTNPCPLPATTGACCTPGTGACLITTQTACEAGSNWLGAGVLCNAQTCPVPPPGGACCDPATGTCTVTAQILCTGGGVWHQEWPSCSPTNPCPPPPTLGACCIPSTGACSLTIQAACGSPNTWPGAGTNCTPNPCVATQAAITSFSFQGLSPAVTGDIDEAAHTIALTVPFGTDVSALVATFTTTGAAVKVGDTPQTSGTTPNDFTSPVIYMVIAADASTQAYVVTVTRALNPAKAITAFSFQGLSPVATGNIHETAHTIALAVPFGTDVTALVATFTTTGASVKVGSTPQASGTTPNDFTSPVTYTVIAADASTQAYIVTVTAALNPAKAITAFSFQGLSPAVTGNIHEAAHTIALAVPFGTNISALVATFTTTGASVKVGGTLQASGTTPNDFTSPVTYTVMAADASTQAYVVTVTAALNPAKAITAFSFQRLSPAVIGDINESGHTIALIVPYGTGLSALVATFATTGASVIVGSTPQTSGTTPNDFTNPLTYTVIAADASTQAYVVTVMIAPTPVFTGNVTTSATSITLGESFTITASARNDGSLTIWGEIAISFPALNDAADGSRVTGPGSSPGSPWHTEYPTGSPITLRDCTMEPSDYLLTTYSDDNWTQGETATTTLTVTPRSPGEFEIHVRALFRIGTSGCVYAHAVPPNGTDAVDQTNWSTKRLTVSVMPIGMLRIPAGTFTMGSPTDEPERYLDEAQHQVTLTKAMYVSKYEVTQSEWQVVMGWNESLVLGAERPVEQVAWYDAVNYCNQRSTGEGLTAAYTVTGATYSGNHITGATVSWNQAANGYRLLTEAEWEYACRATSTTAFCNGGITEVYCAPLDSILDQVGWYCGNASNVTHDVGGKTANAWGLKDMHGNVLEWCWDWYEPDPGNATDPAGPASGSDRVIRGGSWYDEPPYCRSAIRWYYAPGLTDSFLGLRLARTAP